MVLIVALWYLGVGAALTSLIVNAERINRETEAYAVKADADVKRSISLANDAFAATEKVTPPEGLVMGFEPLASEVDPYAAPQAKEDPVKALIQAKSQGAPGAVEAPKSVVIGVGGSGANYFAIITQGSSSRLYRVGEYLGEWQIIKISDSDVIVSKGPKAVALEWKGDR